MGHSQHVTTSTITLLLANQVEDILASLRPPSVLPVQTVQVNPTNIAYDVEHVFVENGREVRKMPVLVNNETVWVDCIPHSPSVEQRDNHISPVAQARRQQAQELEPSVTDGGRSC